MIEVCVVRVCVSVGHDRSMEKKESCKVVDMYVAIMCTKFQSDLNRYCAVEVGCDGEMCHVDCI